MPNIQTVIEGKRGCGYRKPGGLYFRSDGLGEPCGKLPIPLDVCKCCGQGIKPTRGFTWITSNLFTGTNCGGGKCLKCPFNFPENERMGLLWIGGMYYKNPDDFLNEARKMGVSRRISQVPRDFEVGKTWICLAHRTVEEKSPGIFYAFKPNRIEYTVSGYETNEELERMEKRGFTLVKIVKDYEAQLTIAE